LTGVLLFIPTATTSADMINPEFNTKHCKPGEKEITASYSSKEPFGPRTSDETKKYENNPNFYELSSHGSSFGGEVKYCQTGKDLNNNIVGGGIAGIVALAVIGLVWLRRRSAR
jgi:hypothetical protein